MLKIQVGHRYQCFIVDGRIRGRFLATGLEAFFMLYRVFIKIVGLEPMVSDMIRLSSVVCSIVVSVPLNGDYFIELNNALASYTEDPIERFWLSS